MISRNGGEFYLAEGEGNTWIGLVHETFGRDDYAKSVATELAKNHHWAAAIDKFRPN